MSSLLDRAVAAVRELSSEQQDEAAAVLMQWTSGEGSVVVLTAEEEASFEVPLAEAARGEFVSDDKVRALWAKYRL